MKRIKLFEEHSEKETPRFNHKEITEVINSADLDKFFSIDAEKVKLQAWADTLKSGYVPSDPGYIKTQFVCYIIDSGIKCDFKGFKEKIKESFLKSKKGSQKDLDLLNDLGELGFTKKYYSLQTILNSIDNEKDLSDMVSTTDKDYILDTMIDDPKSNPVEVWTKFKEYVGEIKFEKEDLIKYITRKIS